MSNSPSPTGDNGRDGRGRFSDGNRFAKGNPHAQRVGQLRSMFLEAVTDDDWLATARKLIDDAKAGDRMARRELFERVLGKPIEADRIERIEQLEARLAEQPERARLHRKGSP